MSIYQALQAIAYHQVQVAVTVSLSISITRSYVCVKGTVVDT